MIQFSKKRDFSDDGTRNSIISVKNRDLLNSNDSFSFDVAATENCTETTFTKLLKKLHIFKRYPFIDVFLAPWITSTAA